MKSQEENVKATVYPFCSTCAGSGTRIVSEREGDHWWNRCIPCECKTNPKFERLREALINWEIAKATGVARVKDNWTFDQAEATDALADIPQYTKSHTLILYEILRVSAENVSFRVTYLNALREVVSSRAPKNSVGTAMVSDFMCITASAREHCEAFLAAFKKQLKP